jgi:hypothetical protein
MTFTEPNSLLSLIPKNFEAVLQFRSVGETIESTNAVDPYLFWREKGLRIILRQPFLFEQNDRHVLVDSETTFRLIAQSSKFSVLSLRVNETGALIVECRACRFTAFSGVSFGWGIYLGNRELMQHYGVGEGLEWADDFATAVDTLKK